MPRYTCNYAAQGCKYGSNNITPISKHTLSCGFKTGTSLFDQAASTSTTTRTSYTQHTRREDNVHRPQPPSHQNQSRKRPITPELSSPQEPLPKSRRTTGFTLQLLQADGSICDLHASYSPPPTTCETATQTLDTTPPLWALMEHIAASEPQMKDFMDRLQNSAHTMTGRPLPQRAAAVRPSSLPVIIQPLLGLIPPFKPLTTEAYKTTYTRNHGTPSSSDEPMTPLLPTPRSESPTFEDELRNNLKHLPTIN